jgi:hypothetical protein
MKQLLQNRYQVFPRERRPKHGTHLVYFTLALGERVRWGFLHEINPPDSGRLRFRRNAWRRRLFRSHRTTRHSRTNSPQCSTGQQVLRTAVGSSNLVIKSAQKWSVRCLAPCAWPLTTAARAHLGPPWTKVVQEPFLGSERRVCFPQRPAPMRRKSSRLWACSVRANRMRAKRRENNCRRLSVRNGRRGGVKIKRLRAHG